jgi:hypothetical protein
VNVWGNGGTSGACRVAVYVSRATAAVVGRQVFYNNSAYDGRTAGASAEDDAAVAPDKLALRSGQAATTANVTTFSAGINGILLDVKGLRRELTVDDFEFAMTASGGGAEWAAAPAPAMIGRRAGAGVDGSDRVTLIWPDGSIVNRWLRVAVKAREDNDFAADDVFYFGNLTGDTGDDVTGAMVTANDVLRTRAHQSRQTSLIDSYDFNRDGRVNAVDQAIARANFSRSLEMLTPPPPPAVAFSNTTIVAVPLRQTRTRRSPYDPPSTLLG